MVPKLTANLIIGLCLALLLVRCTTWSAQFEEQTPSSVTEKSTGVLFQDEFGDPNSGWPIETGDNASFGYQPPSFYFLEVGTPNESLMVFRELDFDNFAADVKLLVNSTETPDGDFHYGLAIRRSGEQYYAFLISPRTETWRVLKHSSAGVEVLKEAKNDSISSLYTVYTLSVEANGAAFSFQINDQPVIELIDPDYAKGEVGFFVETLDEERVRVIYDSLLIQELEDEVPVVLASPTLGPLTDDPGPVSLAAVASPSPTSNLAPTTTPTPLALLPTLLPTSTPASPTSTPSLTPTATPALPTPTTTPTLRPSPLPTTTSVSVTVTPGFDPPNRATSIPTPDLPIGDFVLLNPLAPNEVSYGPTDFEWEWSGPVPADYGFEVRVWREGEPLAGAHDAVLDNQNGSIVSIGPNKYRLSLDVGGTAGVRGRSGEYLWTVALVQISPDYADLGQQAAPARFRFEAGGGGGDSGGGGDGNGGGGVGID